MRRWILLAALLSTAALAGPAYKWVDETGQVHYSDRPRPGAEKVQLPAYRSPGDNRPARPPTAQATPAEAEEPTDPDRPYELMEISAPTEQETLWNTGGNLNVAVNMSPRLRRGDRLVIYLDGERLGINPPSASFVLQEVFRGEHRLQIAVVDGFDQEVVRTLPRRFMIQQASALNPQRANINPGANPGRN
jgi:hypothetical protein